MRKGRNAVVATLFGLVMALHVTGDTLPRSTPPTTQSADMPFDTMVASGVLPDDVRRTPGVSSGTAGPAKVSKTEVAAQQIAVAVAADEVGFAEIELSNESEVITVRWKGELPSALAASIEEVRASGITVTVENAAYTEREMTSLLLEAVALPEQVLGGVPQGSRPLPDFSGVSIEVRRSVEHSRESTSEMQVEASQLLGAPVRISWVNSEVSSTAWRWADISPYVGGAMMRNDSAGTLCSSGYSAVDALLTADFMVFAAHCADGEWKVAQTDDIIGSTDAPYNQRDAQLISSRRYDIGSYVGAFNSGAYDRYSRMYYAPLVQGSTVFPSGAASGMSAAEVIDPLYAYDLAEVPGPQGPGFLTQSLTGADNVGGGDSGGPVYNQDSLGRMALGIISAILWDPENPGDCVGYQPPGRQCSDLAIHNRLNLILDYYGLEYGSFYLP